MDIKGLIKSEVEYIKINANLTNEQSMLLELRATEHTYEECAELMNVSISTAKRINKKLMSKIEKLTLN